MLGGFIEGDFATGMRFIGLDEEFIGVDIFETEIGEFADANAGLEEEFDNGVDADVVTAGIA